jgi:uracil-DNA glycosylase
MDKTKVEQRGIKIENSWKEALQEEFEKEYFKNLVKFIKEEKKSYTIYPEGKNIFAAFDNTPLPAVRVVLLGQDPYHGPGQAHGLCFSVPDGVPFPPSLRNIFKELNDDLGVPLPSSGNLTKWAEQGVFLLNATLTVRANSAGSHQGKGWEIFTDKVIKTISDLRSGIIFLLWGNFAQKKEELIDKERHFVLKAAHPSPLSATRGFFGSKHFSKTNTILKENGLPEINWDLTQNKHI